MPWFKATAALHAALLALIVSSGHGTAIAAETAPLPMAAYQLGVSQAAASRLLDFSQPAPDGETPKGPAIPRRFAHQRFAVLIDEAARNTALDPALVHAVIAVESGYNPAARSVKGAIGLMQVLPETAARYGVADPAVSPEANLRAGTRYLSYLMTLFENRIELVLAAYNAGEHAVLRHGHRIPPYRETQQYVPAVLAKYHAWREPGPKPPTAPAAVRIQYLPGTVLNLNAVDALIYRSGNIRRPGQP